MKISNKYNDIDYFKAHFKEDCFIHFEYKESLCSIFYTRINKNNKYPIYFSCETPYSEMKVQYFNTIEDFFENTIIEGEKAKDIWSIIEIIRIEEKEKIIYKKLDYIDIPNQDEEYNIKLALKLVSKSCIHLLNQYEDKLKMYDILIWQNLQKEKESRKNNNLKIDLQKDITEYLNDCLQYQISPELINECLINHYNKKDISQINKLIEEFNFECEKAINDYITNIDSIIEYTNYEKEFIESSKVNIFFILTDKIKQRKLKRLNEDIQIRIQINRQELCFNIINSYIEFSNIILNDIDF